MTAPISQPCLELPARGKRRLYIRTDSDAESRRRPPSGQRLRAAYATPTDAQVQLGDCAVQRADDRDELARDAHLQLLLAPREPTTDAVELWGAVESAQRHLVARVELVQMPAQPLLCAAPLVDEVVAVVDQQLELTVDALLGP